MTNLAVIESGIINIYSGESQNRIVSGKELHEFLEIVTPYPKWFSRMVEYGFDENIDYVVTDIFVPNSKGGKQTHKDHYMKLDMAKEVSMIQRNEKGRAARLYFIEVEKKYQQQNNLPSMTIEDMIIHQATVHKEFRLRQEAQERELQELREKALDTESDIIEMKSYMVDSPDFKTVEHEINKYARRHNMKQSEVRNMIYRKIEDLHGINVMQRAKNSQKKLQEERQEQGKKLYAQSTLNQKINGMTIVKNEKLEKKILEILASY